MKRLVLAITLMVSVSALHATDADSLPGSFSGRLQWRAGVEVSGGFVPRTNKFLKGDNLTGQRVGGILAGALRADFSFNPESRVGRLYRGVYQGVGVDVHTFMVSDLLGTPASAYVYQGAPFMWFGDRLSLGYEWKFGAAMGWRHYDEELFTENTAVSTSVTARMGLSLKLQYRLAPDWLMSLGVEATHFSNGNTSWPNGGVNAVGASLGIAYVINGDRDFKRYTDSSLEAEADRGRWFYDIVAYGAWRKRGVELNGEPVLCPGRFGIVGLQFAPMRRLNRWFATGVALGAQWDESAGLAPYWVENTHGEWLRFYRPPFGKQLSVGLSAHAELTMPIFSVNVGLGYDFVNPHGDKAFFQSLTLKTFVTRRVFINTGYRLGRFQDPQNLMLGIGVRL